MVSSAVLCGVALAWWLERRTLNQKKWVQIQLVPLSKALYHNCFICGQRCKWWSHWPNLTSSVISDIYSYIFTFCVVPEKRPSTMLVLVTCLAIIYYPMVTMVTISVNNEWLAAGPVLNSEKVVYYTVHNSDQYWPMALYRRISWMSRQPTLVQLWNISLLRRVHSSVMCYMLMNHVDFSFSITHNRLPKEDMGCYWERTTVQAERLWSDWQHTSPTARYVCHSGDKLLLFIIICYFAATLTRWPSAAIFGSLKASTSLFATSCMSRSHTRTPPRIARCCMTT